MSAGHIRGLLLPGSRVNPDAPGSSLRVYDWTQTLAIRTLCRLAADGVQTNEIVSEIADALDSLPEESVYAAAAYVCQVGHKTVQLSDSLTEITSERMSGDPVDALRLLEIWAPLYPLPAIDFGDFLLGLMRGDGLRKRHPLLDGAIIVQEEGNPERVEWGETGPPPADLHAIRAACLLRRLGRYDEEVVPALERWQADHPDREVRVRIREYLDLP